jgi:hypothetical protein
MVLLTYDLPYFRLWVFYKFCEVIELGEIVKGFV